MTVELLHGDCIEQMRAMADGCVDMICCDLPYGTTACKWDTVIPLGPLWEQYKRVIKGNGAIVLTASQPFTSALVMSNPKWFRYSMVFAKSQATGHLNAGRMPLREHEDILVFSQRTPCYNPQMAPKKGRDIRPPSRGSVTECYGSFNPAAGRTVSKALKFPTSILRFSTSPTGGDKGLHPTQKPVALIEYLIRTYTNPGETVLDNCMGSGTTGVACINTGRNFIGIDQDSGYVAGARRRLGMTFELEAAD